MKPYSSINNSSNQEYMDKVKALDIKEWFVTEKIHGSNLSVIVNDNVILYALKEGDLINDYFYNFEYTMKPLEEKYKELYQYLKSKYNITEIRVVGEFAGGGYPHVDTEHLINTNYRLVQQEVYYAPFNFHYVFDILINGIYLDFNEVWELCLAFNLNFAKPLFRGTLDECLEYPNDTNSVIADEFMPDFPINNNIREGNVIRPRYETRLPNGSRVIIKHKNDKFSEIKKDIDPILLQKINREYIDESVKLLVLEAAKYINKERLNNVLSKLNDKMKQNVTAVNGKFTADVVKDFEIDNVEYRNLGSKQQKYINGEVNKLCMEYLKNNWV